MTDWIEHTTDTCPVDPETVVEVKLRCGYVQPADKAGDMDWGSFWLASARPPLGSPVLHALDVTHYRIITLDKPPEPEMTRRYDDAEAYAERRVRPEMNADAAAALKRQLADAYRAGGEVQALKASVRADPEPDLITLRLECLKLAATLDMAQILGAHLTFEQVADIFLHYVLNGSVDKA